MNVCTNGLQLNFRKATAVADWRGTTMKGITCAESAWRKASPRRVP